MLPGVQSVAICMSFGGKTSGTRGKLRLTQVNFVMLSFPNFRDMSRQNSQLTQRNCEFYANNEFDQLKCGAIHCVMSLSVYAYHYHITAHI
jgi:hypothetical protein